MSAASCIPVHSLTMPVDHVGERPYYRPDPEYISRRESFYRASQEYDRRDQIAMPEAAAPEQAPSAPSTKVDSVMEKKDSPKARESHGAENSDATPTAGGMKLGANAKNFGEWRDRMTKQAEEAGLLTEEEEEEEEMAEKSGVKVSARRAVPYPQPTAAC